MIAIISTLKPTLNFNGMKVDGKIKLIKVDNNVV